MNSTQTDQSIYRALNAAISEIRLLTLHQGAHDQELRCSLKTVSLDDQPEFHALSYVWGAGTDKGRISIDGHVVQVTSSLATLLRQFRSHHHDSLQLQSIPLWIDAVCINQADLEERAQQVRLMGRIYRQASRVLSWIGEGDELSDHAFDRMSDTTFRASCGELKTASRMPTLDEIKVKIIVKNNLEQRRYWSRTWILQEVVLATQDPVILCGSRQIPWSWYMQCKKDLPTNKSTYPSLAFEWAAVDSEVPTHQDHVLAHGSSSLIHEVIRDGYWETESIPFGVALGITMKLAATDPRDLVYGMLGLIAQHELHLVDVDYRKAPEKVFRDTMAALWTSGTDGLLSTVIPGLTFDRKEEKLGLPSWAPDLSKQSFQDNNTLYGAGRHKRWRPERQAEIHVEGNILTLKAIEFDSIADTVEMEFNHGWRETFHRGKGFREVDVEPLQDIEAMAHKGRKIPIPPSSRHAPFTALRGKIPIWEALAAWNEDVVWLRGVGGGRNDEWLPGIPRDRQKLWEILMGRQDIPEAWRMACSPELQNNMLALEAAILAPLLHSINRRVHARKVFISRFGFLGVCTRSVEAGDVVILIAGMKCMYVLRPFQDGYLLVGFANVSDLMDWDDLDEAMRSGSLHEEEFKIY